MFRNLRCLLILPIAALALASCSGLAAPPGTAAAPVTTTANPIAPLASTQVDDKALILAFETFDTVLDTVDALIATGAVQPGTPRAIRIADGLEQTRRWLNAAHAAQQAGQAATYADALNRALTAIASARAAIRGT